MYDFKVNYTDFISHIIFVIISPDQVPIDILKLVIPKVPVSINCRTMNQTSKKCIFDSCLT